MAIDKGTCVLTVQWDDEIGCSVFVCSKCQGKFKGNGRTMARCPKCGAKITDCTISKSDLAGHELPEVKTDECTD